MKTIIYLAVVIAALYGIERCCPNMGDADARGPARTVTSWPWESGSD